MAQPPGEEVGFTFHLPLNFIYLIDLLQIPDLIKYIKEKKPDWVIEQDMTELVKDILTNRHGAQRYYTTEGQMETEHHLHQCPIDVFEEILGLLMEYQVQQPGRKKLVLTKRGESSKAGEAEDQDIQVEKGESNKTTGAADIEGLE